MSGRAHCRLARAQHSYILVDSSGVTTIHGDLLVPEQLLRLKGTW
jgi:hypothetical protein